MSRSETGRPRRRPATKRAGALLLAILMSLVCPLLGHAEAAGLVASIEPSEIALGESAQLSIAVTGDARAPTIPKIDGLEIESAGRSTQIQIVNGQVSRSTRFLYDVRPLRAGSFTLPAFEGASASGESLSTGPLALRVVPPGASRATAPLASPSAGNDEPESADAAAGQGPRFEVVRSTDELFVGQLEPVELRLLIPDAVELTELAAPSLAGAGFTITPLAQEQPTEVHTMIDGVPTMVLTWHAAVSAVKPGAQQLDGSVEAVVAQRSPARARRSGGHPSLFGDDFFGGSLLDQFFGNTRRQRLHLTSEPLRVEVQPLPEEGRPADFAGAVGEFRFAAQAKPVHATAGDPVTLELAVDGRGNFDRVSLAGLGNVDGFKAYTPSARFEGTDPTGLEGRKLFEQTIIPEHGGAQSVPPQSFSFFDPKTRQYVTLHSDALPLEVAGAAAPVQTADAAPGGEDASAASAGVLPLRSDLGRLRHDTKPLFLRPAFFVAGALPLLVLGVCAGIGWRRRRRLDPKRARAIAMERAVNESVRAMEDACVRSDAPAFHAAARRALQARLGHRLDVNPAAVTVADVEARLVDDPRLAASVRRVLEEADAFAYAGSAPDGAALGNSRGFVLETLKQLEARK